jgi:hypothetical protein
MNLFFFFSFFFCFSASFFSPPWFSALDSVCFDRSRRCECCSSSFSAFFFLFFLFVVFFSLFFFFFFFFFFFVFTGKGALAGRANDHRGMKQLEKVMEVGVKPTNNKQDADFKFNIQIKHKNERGEEVTTREAFRLLSHAMHGKKPSKNKQEKDAKKREQELKRMTMSATDTPLQIVQKSSAAMKKMGQAYVELDTKRQLTVADFSVSAAGGAAKDRKK